MIIESKLEVSNQEFDSELGSIQIVPIPGPKGDPGEKGEKGDTGAAGKDGANGYTPVKGIDYYTEADKSEMVRAVLAALPTYNGEVEAL